MSGFLDYSNKHAYQFICKNTKLVDKLFTPLKVYCGMTSLAYVKHFYDGSFLPLLNGFEDFAFDYLSGIDKEGEIFTRMINSSPLHEYKYFIWPKNYGNDKAMELRYNHNRWHGISIVHRNEMFVELMNFSFDRCSDDKTNFFINNLPILTEFFKHFKTVASSTINHSDKTKLGVYKQPCDFKYDGCDNTRSADVMQSIASCGLIIETPQGLVKISQREKECIKLLGVGKSIKEIALVLKVSPRTVDTYLSRVREKTGTTSKSGLLEKVLGV